MWFWAIVTAILMLSSVGWSWGYVGHRIIAQEAAHYLADQDSDLRLSDYAASLGYDANVPDTVWRKLKVAGHEIESIEAPEHFFDWSDKLEKIFQSPVQLPEDFETYRSDLNRHGVAYRRENGLLFWRIRQFEDQCPSAHDEKDFITCIGEMAHYLGDLTQPLHMTDNYDGQFTNQKGVHAYFEEDVVNAVQSSLPHEVAKKMRSDTEGCKNIKELQSQAHDIDKNIRREGARSLSLVPQLLALDKKDPQRNLEQGVRLFHDMILEQLTHGACLTAYAWQAAIGRESKDVQGALKKSLKEKIRFQHKPRYVFPIFEGGSMNQTDMETH